MCRIEIRYLNNDIQGEKNVRALEWNENMLKINPNLSSYLAAMFASNMFRPISLEKKQQQTINSMKVIMNCFG